VDNNEKNTEKNGKTGSLVDAYKRHDLLWLSDAGRHYALRHVQSCIPRVDDAAIRALLCASPPVPAIVTRQDAAEPDTLRVGFSFPRVIDGLRLRIAARVPPDCVTGSKTPFDVADGGAGDGTNAPDGAALDGSPLATLIAAGNRCHTRIGCYGSVALQMVTGLPYRNGNSDLDLYLRHEGSREELELFFQSLLDIERGSGVRIDAEIEYRGQYGVKLKELFGTGASVMGKGLYEVALLPKTWEAALSRRSG
jgi:phosphoribosyl-dephospho-CoA transferase